MVKISKLSKEIICAYLLIQQFYLSFLYRLFLIVAFLLKKKLETM